MATIQENRTKWIDALRSGQYEQGHTYLRRDNAYCAQGVAYDALGGEWKLGFMDASCPTLNGLPCSLPEETLEALGLSSQHVRNLVRLNDHDKTTFDQIADWVEGLS